MAFSTSVLGVSDLLFQRGREIVYALREFDFDLMETFLELKLQAVKAPLDLRAEGAQFLLQNRAYIFPES